MTRVSVLRPEIIFSRDAGNHPCPRTGRIAGSSRVAMPMRYVGVTGIATEAESLSVLAEFNEAGFPMHSPHVPMLGFLVNHQSLGDPGARPASSRYVRFGELRGLLALSSGKALTMIHYHTREPSLAGQVARLFEGVYDVGLCRALQLNLEWPEAEEVGRIKAAFPEMEVVLQLSHEAMRAMSNDPRAILDRIRQYGHRGIDHVVIDPSGGRGKGFSLEASLFLPEIERELRRLPNLQVGIANGFKSANTGERLRELIMATGPRDFSIDAEGGLRRVAPSGQRGVDEGWDRGEVRGYLRAAASELLHGTSFHS